MRDVPRGLAHALPSLWGKELQGMNQTGMLIDEVKEAHGLLDAAGIRQGSIDVRVSAALALTEFWRKEAEGQVGKDAVLLARVFGLDEKRCREILTGQPGGGLLDFKPKDGT